MAEAKSPVTRPLSPHIQIYKPMLTMTMSIVHRITGGALYVGTLLLAYYLISVAGGKDAYALAASIFGSFLGKLVLFGYSWALIHHLFGGIRHLIWDTGRGLTHPVRENIVLATLIGSVGLTAILWILVLVR